MADKISNSLYNMGLNKPGPYKFDKSNPFKIDDMSYDVFQSSDRYQDIDYDELQSLPEKERSALEISTSFHSVLQDGVTVSDRQDYVNQYSNNNLQGALENVIMQKYRGGDLKDVGDIYSIDKGDNHVTVRTSQGNYRIEIDRFKKYDSYKYIGGVTPEVNRVNFLKEYDKYNDKVNDVANQYNLPPNYLKTLLAMEGVYDYIIKDHNRKALQIRDARSKGKTIYKPHDDNPKKFEEDSLIESEIYLLEYGYDIVNEIGEWDKITPYLKKNVEQPDIIEFINEKKENRLSGRIRNEEALDDAFHLIAAKSEQLKEHIERLSIKHGIPLGDDEWMSYWIGALWNSGTGGGSKAFIENRGKYVIPTYNGKVTLGTNGIKLLNQYRELNKYPELNKPKKKKEEKYNEVLPTELIKP